LDDDFPGDAHEAEPEALRELQATYRRRLKAESELYHPLNSRDALESSVLKLRDDLTRLRRGVKQWAAAVILLLLILVGAVIWLKSGQGQENKGLSVNKGIAPECDQSAGQIEERFVGRGGFLEAHKQFAIAVEPGMGAFDHPATGLSGGSARAWLGSASGHMRTVAKMPHRAQARFSPVALVGAQVGHAPVMALA
jgi:hypothetical protein